MNTLFNGPRSLTCIVAFVGLISNINYLADRFTWLEWILKIPQVILGVITGLLPAVLLAVLMALVPIVCRLMAKLAGYGK
jgi:hypothetical protein